jgi:hypothetical protein
MSEINVNDKVSFSGRGRTIIGTVTEVKYSRPGSRHALVKAYGLPTPTQRKLVVMPDDGQGVWTVPERMCKLVAKGGGDPKARSQASQVINNVAQQRSQRASQGREAADTAGLYALKKGADIEVMFNDVGWQPRKFSHLTHSGQVGFYREGAVVPDPLGMRPGKPHIRFTPAKFVRKLSS